MRSPGRALRLVLPPLLAGALAACGPRPALHELRGGVLFYAWPHGSTLSEDPDRVREITRARVRELREIEDFGGTLDEWESRTGPIARLTVGADDYALGTQIFFYYLASLRSPAEAVELEVRVVRRSPGGETNLDQVGSVDTQVNRRAQSGGLLLSLNGLPAGPFELIVQVLDGDRVAAEGVLEVDLLPEAVVPGAPASVPARSPGPAAIRHTV